MLGNVQVVGYTLMSPHATDQSQRAVGGRLHALQRCTRFNMSITLSIKKCKYVYHVVRDENLCRSLIWSRRDFHFHSCSLPLLLHSLSSSFSLPEDAIFSTYLRRPQWRLKPRPKPTTWYIILCMAMILLHCVEIWWDSVLQSLRSYNGQAYSMRRSVYSSKFNYVR